MEAGTPTLPKAKINWVNLLFIISVHFLAVAAVVYMAAVQFSWWSLGLGLLWLACSSISITGGYHRLFAHNAYKASWPLRLFYLLFGAAGVQNSALKWSADHRVHHTKVDTVKDPYNINRGFWWAHIVWIFYLDPDGKATGVKDLQADKLVMFQHKHYLALAILMGAVVPFSLGLIWGDPIGAMLITGFLRLLVQWHATFSVNSFTHIFGKQPFSVDNSARDSFLTALITLGEGYHNYHHRFQTDYRNGICWYHFDPTKWFVWSLSKVGLTRELKRTAREKIERARESVRAQKTAATTALVEKSANAAHVIAERADSAKQAIAETADSAKQAIAETADSAKQAFAETADSANALAQSVLEAGRPTAPVMVDESGRRG